ncbi:MAG: MoxR-like ATPase [Saprospiraceae bacterium]|jgi:MoxR-like ATPase
MNNKTYRIYQGSGELNALHEVTSIDSSEGYLPSEDLVKAVNVAILLGKPLLVTGEPGTGKTLLAKSIAETINEDGKPLDYYEFTAKTTSTARDLLYYYDSIGHFHEANRAKIQEARTNQNSDLPVNDNDALRREEYDKFISFTALGQAIKTSAEKQTRSVVLIDEIDKTSRDFPNDILTEIDKMKFTVQETGETFQAPSELRPIIIITSNSERLLPDAFLRRCVFYHIDFPSTADLKRIVNSRLSEYKEGSNVKYLRFSDEDIDWIISHFEEIRDLCRKKKPATAEFLSWVLLLDKFEFKLSSNRDDLSEEQRDVLLTSYAVLAKHQEDFEALKSNLN